MKIEEQLLTAMEGCCGVDAADRLCQACVALLDVQAAAISLVFDGTSIGTLGASSAPARMYDEVQFTIGEGPGLDSVSQHTTVVAVDLDDPRELRWPAYAEAMLAHQIRGVYAVPVALAGRPVGALELFRNRPGVLDDWQSSSALQAAVLAELPLLDLLTQDLKAAAGDPDSTAWAELNTLGHTEVNQATGMLMSQLNIKAGAALVRLRAHAYATDRPVTDVARDILHHQLRLEAD